MTTELQRDENTRPTGRRYASVKDLMQGEDIPAEVKERVSDIERNTRLVQMISELRVRAGLTQEEMAKKLDLSQSQVSKIEHGRDEDLTIAVLRAYSDATGGRIGVVIGKPLSHVESVKAYALGMRDHMLALARMANEHEEMERDIKAFFGEAFFNILDILARCGEQLPNKGNVSQVKATLIGNKVSARPAAQTASGLAPV
jgi:transcriptional regulator with XRE-family HTH domain